MHCAKARAAISASLDGEATGFTDGELAVHLGACDACTAWQERAHRLTRHLRLQEAPRLAVPAGLLDAVARAAPPRRRWAWSPAVLARSGLAVLGVALVLLALPGFVLGHDQAAPAGVARELGALEGAAGLGLLAAAARLRLAAGARVLAGAGAALFAVAAVADLATGDARLTTDVPGLLLAAGWLLLEVLARLDRRRASTGGA